MKKVFWFLIFVVMLIFYSSCCPRYNLCSNPTYSRSRGYEYARPYYQPQFHIHTRGFSFNGRSLNIYSRGRGHNFSLYSFGRGGFSFRWDGNRISIR